ncbi:hypothetical protein DMENIID0001_038160 [Sergentomyia squamirostris]
MSRWGKNRNQAFAVPIESLIKEKENTNRPTAARSAGTVGKWGVTSFTSMRGVSIYGRSGFSQYSPNQETSPAAYISPTQDSQNNLNPAVPELPKPKKFFKSRNTVPAEPFLIQSPQTSPSVDCPRPPAFYSQSTSSSDAQPAEKPAKRGRKPKEPKPEKVEKPPKKKAVKSTKGRQKAIQEEGEEKVSTEGQSKVAEPPPSKRYLARSRKVVNYNEDNSRSPSPVAKPPVPVPRPEDDQTVGASPPKTSAPDHPPIVLRISKGTSRLVSTDSDEVNTSPPYSAPVQTLPPPVPPTSQATIGETVGALSSTAELLAVLSEQPAPPVVAAAPDPPIDTPVSRPEEDGECLKIKIRTDTIKGYINSTNLTQVEPPPKATRGRKKAAVKTVKKSQDQRVTRASTRHQEPEELPHPRLTLTLPVIKKPGNSPLPGSENYDLYRTLASPSDRDFDSQSSVLGSVSSNNTPTPVALGNLPLEESCVIRRRESSDGTSDIDTSQHSSLVAPPSEINVRLNAISESSELDETDTGKITEEVKITKECPKPVTPQPPPPPPPPANRRVTRRTMKSTTQEEVKPPTPLPAVKEPPAGRVTRNNNNGNIPKSPVKAPPARSYTRKRRGAKVEEEEQVAPVEEAPPPVPEKAKNPETLPNSVPEVSNSTNQDGKSRAKYRRGRYGQKEVNNESSQESVDTTEKISEMDDGEKNAEENNGEKPSVKLLISKKKGSIFKSRALVTDAEASKKRHVYKHKWDDDSKGQLNADAGKTPLADEFSFEGTSSSHSRLPKPAAPGRELDDVLDFSKDSHYDPPQEKYYTRVRNVKKAHQIQEIGEFQEMDDDVEYILDALQPHNPLSTRCLSAIQLSSKCMIPAFRMHVRAHGTVAKFFRALRDATRDESLGLCTATIMFVLSQDNLNMDLDRDSLELMLSLLESDVSHANALDDAGLSLQQLQRNKQKVRELCEEVKNQGKAQHLNLDNITVGTLAMETLLSLTSKRAGEWFKEELRDLGGLEHIIKTICECCRQISDYVVNWTDALLDKLRKIERCLRVLENVMEMNEQNQSYVLKYRGGHAIDTLVKLYKLCDREIALYPTNDLTPKEDPGVVIREALVPTLKVLINLTHPFNERAVGAAFLGGKDGLFDTSLHLLLQGPNYVPEKCIFELSILVLLLLINLTMHTVPNRTIIMEANAMSDFGSQFDKVPAIKALVEFFYKCEELARLAEQKTDDLLDSNPKKSEKKHITSQEEVEETVTKCKSFSKEKSS